MNRISFCITGILMFVFSVPAVAQEMPYLYFVDAHSQLPAGQDSAKIIELMDKAGVWKTILSARNDRKPKDVSALSKRYPERIIAAVRSKGKSFNKGSPKFSKLINKQASNPRFQAVGEAILYHAKKGKKAPRIVVAADSPQNKLLLNLAISRGWPFIAHYEFAAAGWSKPNYMNDFEAMVRAHPKHPFVLIHMGQLKPVDVKRLIDAHENVFFIMSHSNPITIAENHNQPWTNLFERDDLAPKWLDVISQHSDRFILGFDNVWPEHWGRFYLNQATLWRNALAKLPMDIAQALAHGNAERLWNLEPRQRR